MFIGLQTAFAAAPPPSGGGQMSGGGAGSLISTLVMFLAIILIFYFFMIRPQQKKQKEHAQMIQSLKKGDKVITSAGIHGTIAEIDDKTFVLQVNDNTRITFDRGAIAGKLQQ